MNDSRQIKAFFYAVAVTEINFPSMFDANVLNNEWESTPDAPHTLIVEGQKP